MNSVFCAVCDDSVPLDADHSHVAVKHKRMDDRVTAELHPGSVWLKREAKKTANRLSSAKSHGWRETGRWEISHDGISEIISPGGQP